MGFESVGSNNVPGKLDTWIERETEGEDWTERAGTGSGSIPSPLSCLWLMVMYTHIHPGSAPRGGIEGASGGRALPQWNAVSLKTFLI